MDDKTSFLGELEKFIALYDAEPRDPDLWWSVLCPYAYADVAAAFEQYLTESRGGVPPKPSDIVGRIKSSTGHPRADEAWAIALRAMDEGETVVWTDEIAAAWGVARSIMAAGDAVGARLGFRAAYERARPSGKPSWRVSLGHDPDRRDAAVKDAITRGLIARPLDHQRLAHSTERDVPTRDISAMLSRVRDTMSSTTRLKDGNRIAKLVAELPEDPMDRRNAIEAMDGSTAMRVRHILGESERDRQVGDALAQMSQDERMHFEALTARHRGDQ